MNLIYRSQNFEYAPAPAKFTHPRAVNWRHQLPGISYRQNLSYGQNLSPRRPTLQPRAVNWRYQLP